MQLNGSVVNGAGLNGPARITFLLAFCALAGGVTVSAQPSVTRYCAGQVNGSVVIQADALQRHASKSALACTANVLAVEPYQTFASASLFITSGATSASAVAIRQPQSLVFGTGLATASARTKQVASTALLSTAEVVALGFSTKNGNSSLYSSSAVVSNPKVIRKAAASFSGMAGAVVNGEFVQSAKASAGGNASITAFGGYAKPSATALLSGANVFAYAKATRLANAGVGGTAQITAKAKNHAYGSANINGTVVMGAWVVQMQGNSFGTLCYADTEAEATYVHRVHTSLVGGVTIDASPYVARYVEAAVTGRGQLRVESTLNNLLDGYADPGALSVLSLNANGVVVAPLISHFDGSSDIHASATYVHKANVTTQTDAQITALALYIHQASAVIAPYSVIDATAHWKWSGDAAVLGSVFDIDVFPNQRHQAKALLASVGTLYAIPTYIFRAGTATTSTAEMVVSSDVVRYCTSDVVGNVVIVASPATVGSPTTRDPLKRTMYRKKTNRTMLRPYVNRVMKAKVK